MALYCSRELFDALDGMRFPATKEDLIEFAEMKDAPESVLIILESLDDKEIYHGISDVCENAKTVCTFAVVKALSHAPFPARREDLLEYIDRINAPPSVRNAVFALPPNYTFHDLDEMCAFIL
ncbi:MAG: DUF2795 domain-containing protein [Armatimonadota bacterium]